VRFTTKAEPADHHDPIETPYDGEARDRHQRGLDWIGYAVHLSETCDGEPGHLTTHVNTTPANVAAAQYTAAIQRALVAADRAPNTPLADAGYMAADRLVQREARHGMRLVGLVRESACWQHHVDGASAMEQVTIDWAARSARCPQGRHAVGWYPPQHARGHHDIRVTSAKEDWAGCPQRARCPRAKPQPRSLQRQP
jgi:transposase